MAYLLTLLAFLVSSLFSPICASFVHFELEITSASVDPAGIGARKGILVNGTFPAPELRINQGDDVSFIVHNRMRVDTAVHFHGISQSTTPWSDGVPGVTQKAIRPGASFRYQWRAEEAGVYFYHAHERGQIMDGLYGAIVVTAPESADRPFHLIGDDAEAMMKAEREIQPLLISDWTQFTFGEFYEVEESANIDYTCMDAILVNGVGAQYCPTRKQLDAYTNPLVKQILAGTSEKGITAKGCVPPLQLFQGNFTLHLDNLPDSAYRTCTGGEGKGANYTVDVAAKDGWAALSFINPGGLYPLKVTIDNHKLHVYEVDGQYIEPQTVDQLLVNNGNRISVLIKLDQRRASYKIRLANDLLGQVLGGFAELVYDGATDEPEQPRALMNYAGQPLSDEIVQFSEAAGKSYPPTRPATKADRTFKFLMRKLGQPYGAYEWSLSGTSGYNMSEEDLPLPHLFNNPSSTPSSDLILKTNKNDWIDLILEVEGPFAQAHPMHKHGNKAFILGHGLGGFPWPDIETAAKELPPDTFNFADPPHRDSLNTIEGVRTNTWLALRYEAENPGAWLFHCHIQTHLAGGMGVVILDGVDQWPEVPEEYWEWNGFERPGVGGGGRGVKTEL